VFCSRCGAKNPEGSANCFRCGQGMVKVPDCTPQTKPSSPGEPNLDGTKPIQRTISEFGRGLSKTAKWSAITLGVLIALGAVYKVGDYLDSQHQQHVWAVKHEAAVKACIARFPSDEITGNDAKRDCEQFPDSNPSQEAKKQFAATSACIARNNTKDWVLTDVSICRSEPDAVPPTVPKPDPTAYTWEEARHHCSSPGTQDKLVKTGYRQYYACPYLLAYRNRVDANPEPKRPVSGTVSTTNTRINVDTANAYIRDGKAETKLATDIMKKWDADNNAAKGLAELKQIAIDEGSFLDQAVQHNQRATELMSVVGASYPTSCVKSAIRLTEMANEDLAVEVLKKNLLIESDITTSAGVASYRRALAPLTAREHAIVSEKNTYMASAEYINACGPND
jgi:hypothetical protein